MKCSPGMHGPVVLKCNVTRPRYHGGSALSGECNKRPPPAYRSAALEPVLDSSLRTRWRLRFRCSRLCLLTLPSLPARIPRCPPLRRSPSRSRRLLPRLALPGPLRSLLLPPRSSLLRPPHPDRRLLPPTKVQGFRGHPGWGWRNPPAPPSPTAQGYVAPSDHRKRASTQAVSFFQPIPCLFFPFRLRRKRRGTTVSGPDLRR